jgi:hypothetical protein
MPYGVDDIGMFASEGFWCGVFPFLEGYVRSQDLRGDWAADPVCSQAAAMAVRYGFQQDNFFSKFGVGIGKEVPGDFRKHPDFMYSQGVK